MSPRAAWRLESLGFTEVLDYGAGKSDWIAAGLPTEGTDTGQTRLKDIARRDVPICHLEESVGELRERVSAGGWTTCMVVNKQGILLGRLYKKELEGDAAATAEAVMREGPSTFRTHVTVVEMLAFMQRHDLHTAPVTTSDGRFFGMALREDVEAAVHASHHHEP